MKKKLLTAMCVLGCALLTACSGNNSADTTISDSSTIQNEESKTSDFVESSVYDIIFKDGHSCHCRTKKDVRSCIIEHCNEKGD